MLFRKQAYFGGDGGREGDYINKLFPKGWQIRISVCQREWGIPACRVDRAL